MGEALNTKADIDLNNTGVFSTSEGGVVNLTSSTPANASGKEVASADFFQSNLLNYTTNRILEIPQDIKLELNNGTLTLKAGSKVYVPNGAGKFDVVTIVNDIARPISSNDKYMIFVQQNGTATSFRRVSTQTASGTTTPTSSYWAYYNTTDNKIYQIDNGVNTMQLSFPICIVTVSDGAITSIDKVFNGFGYIGSTIFALPGIKCLVGNGRKSDGSCITKIEETTKVLTFTTMLNRQNNKIVLYNGSVGARFNLLFDEQANMCCDYNGVNTVYQSAAILGTFSTETTSPWNIKEFNPLGVDSLANSNASNFSKAGESYLSGLGMPSGKYIDLTLGASGSTYTAPASGWFVVSGKPTANGGFCILDTNKYEPTYMTTNTNGWYDRGFIPVRKGQVMTLRYGNYEIEADRFKFIYAEGEE